MPKKNVLTKDSVIVHVIPIELEMYVVINGNGEFFRAKGYSGGGNTWVDSIEKAKIYGKIGPARSVVTWFSNTYPMYPTPKIGVISSDRCVVVDESVRVEKAKLAKEKADIQYKLARAQQQLTEAQRNALTAKSNADEFANSAARKVAELKLKLSELNGK